MKPRLYAALVAAILLMATAAVSQQTTTLSQQCDSCNNTSAITGAFDTSNHNAATWNISKVPTINALYAGATTKVYIHFLPWFCMPGSGSPARCSSHIITGYNSNDATVVHNQITDMISRGANGIIVNYYTKTAEDQTAMKVRDESQQHANWEFALMEDKENYKSASDPTQQVINDISYINTNYFSSSAYMRRNGRPVLFFFTDGTAVNWSSVKSAAANLGNPYFIFENSFTHAGGDGAYAWIDTNATTSGYLNWFYGGAQGHSLTWGSAYPGFDDHLATWSQNRFVDRRCGQNWLDAFRAANAKYNSGNQLPNIQLVTWNDYDEGTEIESGIDNCVTISASIDAGAHAVNWSITGDESTIYNYRLYTANYPDTENLTLRGEVMAGGAHSFDLNALPSGDYNVYVQAQGMPSLRNHTVLAGRFTGGSGAGPGSVTITAPTEGQTVNSPVHLMAAESSSHVATTMTASLDGTQVYSGSGESVDTNVTAVAGAHHIDVTATYSDGTAAATSTVNFTVGTAQPAVTISSPANGASVASPIHVIADENTAASATSMQIYLDGSLYVTRFNVDHLDEQVTAGAGSHTLTAKAWYADGTNNMTQITVTVVNPVTISTPADGASTASPIHVVADENTSRSATSMQIYLSGTLYVTRFNVDHLDEQVTAAPGSHTLTAKAWYADGTSNMTQITVNVLSPVTISTPTAGTSVASPIHFVADENTAAAATSMQIYLDGSLYVTRFNVDHLDEQVTAGPGSHTLIAKAWYADGTNNMTQVTVTVLAPVTIAMPASGASVASPIHLVADENTAVNATSMQIYLDGSLYVTRFNVDHLDEQVTAAPGSHTLTAKAWYADGTNNMTQITVTVLPPVTISAPANGATVASPIRVIADENTAVDATSMQIYLDGSLYVTRFNVDHLDELVTAGTGTHTLTAKAWYADGTNNMTQISVTVQ